MKTGYINEKGWILKDNGMDKRVENFCPFSQCDNVRCGEWCVFFSQEETTVICEHSGTELVTGELIDLRKVPK